MAHKHIGIIDVGSNSIRLVVYDGQARTPVAIFNEKVICALGQGLAVSGRLNPEGKRTAIETLGRFVRLARAMEIDAFDVLATAAVRDASDGAEFVSTLEKLYGIEVTVLSGEEEARLSAMGVLCGTPKAHGLVADLGGGSLELVAMDHGKIAGLYGSMPLGLLRLSDASDGVLVQAEQLVDDHLRKIDWWDKVAGRTLYAVGGAWRALARLCIAQTGHPLHVLDNFTLNSPETLRLIALIAHQSRKSVEKIRGMPKRRLPQLPLAAMVLEKLVRHASPERIVFSVYGMREGQFYRRLPAAAQWTDPLIASCAQMARTVGRFPEHGAEILEWMSPLFTDSETPGQARLRHAACLLGDLFWNEHPDYRAEQAFLRVFRLPFMGLVHEDRAALALAIYARYDGDETISPATDALGMLPEEDQRRSQMVGMSLRLGHAVSGGIPGLLRSTRLIPRGNILVLELPDGDPAFVSSLNDRRYDRLARAAGFEAFEMRKV